MATSGSINYSLTRDDIIKAAMIKVGILGSNEDPSSEDYTYASGELNRMIKAWQARGYNLWTTEEASIFLTDETAKYVIDGSSTYGAIEEDVVETSLGADAASSATSLTVGTTSGMATSDVIGVVLDDDTIHWTTISTIPDSTSLTIASGLASAATSGNLVYTYTTALNRPLQVDSVRYRTGTVADPSDFELFQLSRSEYFAITNKESVGTPTSYYYLPKRNKGELYLWPKPDTVSARLKITFSRTLEDFDSSSDEPDFPQEWYDALVKNLALELAPAFGQDAKAIQVLAPLAKEALALALAYDDEDTSLFVHPYMDY